MANIQPLGNHVVVEAIKEELTSSSGIIIPDSVSKEKPMKGKVLAVGPGKMANDGKTVMAPDLEVGDVVLFSKYGPTEVKLEGKEVLILSVDDIFAKLK
ncbi:co-chaperone GroES [Candidatus Peregrinibacteria bacterium CG_4_10_14_0_2_um_filter_38_24]|nr:MAG: co-chaperone GroES [Candidatus Peregrinibacteria bacterium CG_4_10_14_0_2_um_filter_38_24]PJC38864.1 MAG: co-chaperone GroES [Candidatus Peregrinibacteria bacterium CG_4_9_14_0_2_um_filter_38_9]